MLCQRRELEEKSGCELSYLDLTAPSTCPTPIIGTESNNNIWIWKIPQEFKSSHVPHNNIALTGIMDKFS